MLSNNDSSDKKEQSARTGNQTWLTQEDAQSPTPCEKSVGAENHASDHTTAIRRTQILETKETIEPSHKNSDVTHDPFPDDQDGQDSSCESFVTQEDTNFSIKVSSTAGKVLDFSATNDDVTFPVSHEDVNSDSDHSSESDSTSSGEDSILFSPSNRLRNMERQAKFLTHLDTKYANLIPDLVNTVRDKSSARADQYEEQVSGEKELAIKHTPSRGMRFVSARSRADSQTIDETTVFDVQANNTKTLKDIFPNRDLQIRLLTSLLGATIGQVCNNLESKSEKASVFVPPSAFVTGPPGTGKTSIVRHVVESWSQNVASKQHRKSCEIASAYIDCALREPSSIQGLLSNAYSQLRSVAQPKSKQTGKKLKRKRQHSSTSESNFMGHRSKAMKGVVGTRASSAVVESAALNETIDCESNDNLRRTQPSRRAKREGSVKAIKGRVFLETKRFNTSGCTPPTPQDDGSLTQINPAWSSRAAVAAFGRTLRPIFGNASTCCAFFILDHAERLLSTGSNELSNFLAELLLLPKAMELNLTVIVITNNCYLEGTRLKNIIQGGKSLSTLSNGVHPFRIHFPSYKGVDEFRQVLMSPSVLRLIVGDDFELGESKQTFRWKVIESFFNTLVQSLSGSTRDLREYLKLGRSLWPIYIEPLLPSNICKTIGSAQKSAGSLGSCNDGVETALLRMLNQKILDHIRPYLGRGLFSLSLDSPAMVSMEEALLRPVHEQYDVEPSYLCNCLLLSAFICQNNRSDKDRRVFSIRSNGKRVAQSRPLDNAASGRHQLKAVRPRPFPLERMLSIFVTLVGLNTRKLSVTGMDANDLLSSVGTTQLCEYLGQLRGYLHQVKYNGAVKGEQMNLNGAKYWCSLTREHAGAIAKDIDIPLDNYLT